MLVVKPGVTEQLAKKWSHVTIVASNWDKFLWKVLKYRGQVLETGNEGVTDFHPGVASAQLDHFRKFFETWGKLTKYARAAPSHENFFIHIRFS